MKENFGKLFYFFLFVCEKQQEKVIIYFSILNPQIEEKKWKNVVCEIRIHEEINWFLLAVSYLRHSNEDIYCFAVKVTVFLALNTTTGKQRKARVYLL